MSLCGLTILNHTECPPKNLTLLPIDAVEAVTPNVVLELYVMTFLCGAGLLGNLVAMIVMHKDKERKDQLLLLKSLAIADTLYLCAASLLYPTKHLASDDVYVHITLFAAPLLKTAQTIAIWMMMLVTVDRFVYVCKPLTAPTLISTQCRIRCSVAVFLMGVVYNLPRFFENCILQFYDPCTDMTFSQIVYKPSFNHRLYYDIYQYAMYTILLYVLPLTVLLVLNYRLVRAIKYSRRRHQELTNDRHESGETNATIVLVIIIVVFIICETPELLIKIITLINRTTDLKMFDDPVLTTFSMVSELLMVINSSINFFIYIIFGSRFRFVMKETFRYRTSTALTTRETVPLQQPQLYRG